MSEQNQEQNVPTVTDVLFDRVYMPVFMRKIAAAGIQVNSEDEVNHLLEIAHRLRAKSASAEPQSLIKAAASGLRQVDGEAAAAAQYDLDTLTKVARSDEAVTAALDAMFAQEVK